MIRQLPRGGGAELAPCGLSGSSMCHGKENMPPVAGLFKVSFQKGYRLSSFVPTSQAGLAPRASRKQEVSANPGLP